VHTVPPNSNGIISRARAVRAWLRANLAQYDLIHIHSLWRLVPTLAAMNSRRLRIPYLIAPHTALAPWALAQKRPKKMLARLVVWDGLFAAAAGFHALNELEAEEIRACVGRGGPRAFVVPNGVSLREFPQHGNSGGSAPNDAPLAPIGAGRPFILFLARLHTMKGPDLLLEAFAALAPEHPDLQLVCAGPDFGMLESLRRRAVDLRVADRVHFPGLVTGPSKLWLLGTAVCLCQPSRSEGFSLSILEAMASSCPVVISDCCKFPEVGEHGAGIVVPLSVAAIAEALRAYACAPARRLADGRAGRELIERSYTWEKVCKQAEQMYAQVSVRKGPDDAMVGQQR
jgi:glycosyltransferase involved in cell wall biosynthesis